MWVNVSLEAKGVPADGFAEGEEWAIYGGGVAPAPLHQHSGERSPKVAWQTADAKQNLVSPKIGSPLLGQLTRLPSTSSGSASLSGCEPSSLRIGSAEYCAT